MDAADEALDVRFPLAEQGTIASVELVFGESANAMAANAFEQLQRATPPSGRRQSGTRQGGIYDKLPHQALIDGILKASSPTW